MTDAYHWIQRTLMPLYKLAAVYTTSLLKTGDIGQIYADLNPEGRAPTTGVVPGIQYIPRLHGYHAAADAQGVRDIFKYYFNGPGAVAWQLS